MSVIYRKEHTYMIELEDELENLRLNDFEKELVEKVKANGASYRDIMTYRFELEKDKGSEVAFSQVDFNRVVYACIFEKAIEQGIKELTPDGVERIHHTFYGISGVDYSNLHTKSDVMLDVESYNNFGLISENDFLDKLIGSGYLKDENGDKCYGDIYQAFHSIARFESEYGYSMREDVLLDIIENYSDKLPVNNILGHINFWANQYFVDMVTREINEKPEEYKYEEKDDIFHIYDSGDSCISVSFNMDNVEFFKDVVAKHPEFFDDMSNNVKILLSRIDNESDFKETFENNSKSSKNK